MSNLNTSKNQGGLFREEKNLRLNIIAALKRMGLNDFFNVIQKHSIVRVDLKGGKPSEETIFFDCAVAIGQGYCYPNFKRIYFSKDDGSQLGTALNSKLLPGTYTLSTIEESVKAELRRIKSVLVHKNINDIPENIFLALFKEGSSRRFDEFSEYFGHGLSGAQIVLFSDNKIPVELIDSYKGLPDKWVLRINGGAN